MAAEPVLAHPAHHAVRGGHGRRAAPGEDVDALVRPRAGVAVGAPEALHGARVLSLHREGGQRRAGLERDGPAHGTQQLGLQTQHVARPIRVGGDLVARRQPVAAPDHRRRAVGALREELVEQAGARVGLRVHAHREAPTARRPHAPRDGGGRVAGKGALLAQWERGGGRRRERARARRRQVAPERRLVHPGLAQRLGVPVPRRGRPEPLADGCRRGARGGVRGRDRDEPGQPTAQECPGDPVRPGNISSHATWYPVDGQQIRRLFATGTRSALCGASPIAKVRPCATRCPRSP